MVDEYNDFTARLFTGLMAEKGRENIVFSPYSVMNLLTIAAQAAAGDTREEIVNAIAPHCSFEELEPAVAHLARKLSANENVRVSNAAVVAKSLEDKIKDGYAQRLKEAFDADFLAAEDIVGSANAWANEKTDGMIPKVLDDGSGDTLACLINAILFAADWQEEYAETSIFDDRDFTNADGSVSKVTMLTSHEDAWIENKYFTGFCKPYKNGCSYMALLPKKTGKVFLANAIKETDFSALYRARAAGDVYVQMPEFACSFDAELNDICRSFGIKKVFTDAADLSNMCTEELMVDLILHKAKIEVDRRGTRAAAVTAADFLCKGLPEDFDIKAVKLDRPFIYAIIHDETALPIFVGAVNMLPNDGKSELPEGGKAKIDPDLFIHPSDKAALSALKAIPGFSQVVKAFMSIWNEKQYRIMNMSTNLRLSEKQMKKYYDMLPPICEKLGIDIPEIYIELDVTPNAYTYGDTKPFIVLTSGLFETFPDELIPTVIAHECGHIACHHTLYSTMGRMLLNGAFTFVSGLGNVALYPIQLAFFHWMRCSELSADRAAMICDGNADNVVETMMRFAGYDKDIMADANVDEFLAQAKEYREMVDGHAWNKTLEFVSLQNRSHPFNAVRALEAHEWETSDRFKTIMAYMDDPFGTRLPVKLRPQKLIGRKAEDVKNELAELGFETVELQRSTEPGGKAKPGDVIGIAIDGNAECDDDYYLQAAEIALTYYEPKTENEIALEHPGEIKAIESAKFFVGKSYRLAVDALKGMGFTNIETREMAIPKMGFLAKPDMVSMITLDGKDQLKKDEWYAPDVNIKVYYYVKV